MAGVQTVRRPGVAEPVFSHPVRVSPPSVRRRHLLLSVAKHSMAIFFCVVLIALIFTRFLGASPQRR